LSPDSPSGGPGRKIDDPSQAPDGGANESVALGYIASRTVESILILVGVLSLMAVVSLRQDLAATGGTDGARADVLGYLMWRSRLLPRPMVTFGLIGGCPLALVAGVGVLLGAWDTPSGLPVALAAPEALRELSLSVWLLVRGFRRSPTLTGPPA
jgi:hypothetical protein